MSQNSENRRGSRAGLAVRHFLSHVKDELAVTLFDFAQQAAKLVEKAGIFTDAAPGDVIGRLPLGEIRQLRRFFTVIKQMIKWALKSARQRLPTFVAPDRMSF